MKARNAHDELAEAEFKHERRVLVDIRPIKERRSCLLSNAPRIRFRLFSEKKNKSTHRVTHT